MLPPKLILAPIDFSTHSEDAMNVAADLASKLGADLCLVHVVPMLPTLPSFNSVVHEGEYEKELHEEASRRLQDLCQQLSNRGVRATSEVGTANDVGMEILRIGEQEQADMIVIATHGMTGWRRLAFGSVAEKVVRLAACPVLVLRAEASSKEAEAAAASSSSISASR